MGNVKRYLGAFAELFLASLDVLGLSSPGAEHRSLKNMRDQSTIRHQQTIQMRKTF